MSRKILECKNFNAKKFFTLPYTQGDKTFFKEGRFRAERPVTELKKYNLDIPSGETNPENVGLFSLVAMDDTPSNFFSGFSNRDLNDLCLEQGQFLRYLDQEGERHLLCRPELSILFLVTPLREKVMENKSNLFLLGSRKSTLGDHLAVILYPFSTEVIFARERHRFLFSLRCA